MKYLLKNNPIRLMAFAWLTLAAVACEKVENKVIYEGATAPVLAISTTTPALLPANENKPVITFSWTNPNYMFNTGVSSQNVTYNIEMDVAGANFGSANKRSFSVTNDLARTMTVFDLNQFLSGASFMALTPDRPYNIEARAIASIGGAIPVISNVVKFAATPYTPPPTVSLPIEGTLWATGNAFYSGWENPVGPANNAKQKFTETSPRIYEVEVEMPGGGGYKLIQKAGDWGTQYHMISGGAWNSGQFEQKDAEPGFPGPPEKGIYKLTFNFQTGKYTSVKKG